MSLLRAAILGPVLATIALLPGCSHGTPAPDVRLTDDGGRRWALADQRGMAVVVTFGFTHCADTCPATLAKLARVVDALGPRPNGVEIAFVTVDPRRDTPGALHRFVTRFASPHARIVGLTGTPSEIDAVENAFHVWAQRVPGSHTSRGYDVAHTAAVYFIDAAGHIRSFHDDEDSDAVLARALREVAS